MRKNMHRSQHSRDGECMNRCPLAGAAKAVSMMGAACLIVGTEECAYYTKSMLNAKGIGGQCFSAVLDKHAITFGSAEKVEAAAHELLDECRPQALFIITTCVVEIIGDDFMALARDLSERYSLPVEVVQTNHFTGNDDKYGFQLVQQKAPSSIKRPSKMGMFAKMLQRRGGHS